jgi:hypothetical protein
MIPNQDTLFRGVSRPMELMGTYRSDILETALSC